MSAMDLDEYHWLAGPEATRLLDDLSNSTAELVKLAVTLRRHLSATRVHLILEQLELRRRAIVKFPFASQLLLTRRALEQSTDWPLAQYKARRFALLQPRWDACCGIGGDLFALADGATCQGSELDPIAGLFAAVNCQRLGRTATVAIEDAEARCITEFAACHIDPDRRVEGQRTIQLADHRPGLGTLRRILHDAQGSALKLAPATTVPVDWETACEREWITTRGECRQQVVWGGKLARIPGSCTATVLSGAERTASTISGDPTIPVPVTSTLGRYLVDPDPSVSAAHLVGIFAREHRLAAFGSSQGYLTGDQLITHPLAQPFEVLACLPFDQKRVGQWLREHGVGRLELKQRGANQPLEKLAHQFRGAGNESGVLLLARCEQRIIAILARRPSHSVAPP